MRSEASRLPPSRRRRPTSLLVDTATGPEIADDEDDEKSAMQRLSEMTVPQKMSRATKGTREERAILIRDPNKLISVSVLSSPKLTDSEVEAIAKMSSVSDEILRIISTNRNWMKNYVVVSALARNPKTPLPISMNLLNAAEREGFQGAVDQSQRPGNAADDGAKESRDRQVNTTPVRPYFAL